MMGTARARASAARSSVQHHRYVWAAALFIAAMAVMPLLPWSTERFPDAWNLHLRVAIDQAGSWAISHRTSHPLFLYVLAPLSAAIDGLLAAVENLLLALPWPATVMAFFFVAYRTAGRRAAWITVAGLLFMGMIGLWEESMQTLALMGVSVAISVVVGIPVGILMARSPRLRAVLRPILDAMQTLPAFVYLIPVVLLFGIARVPSVVATVIYALPPMIRLTDLGIRQVPTAAVEAAAAFGSTPRQTLFKVQLPLAMPAILAGLNQTIMMALGMVVIAALIGASGLGLKVYEALRQQRVGQGLEAGLAIVMVAVIFDRLGGRMGGGANRSSQRSGGRRGPLDAFSRVSPWLLDYIYWSTAALVVLAVLVVDAYVADLHRFPAALQFSLSAPVDASVRWMRDHLYQIGDLPIGTGPLSDFLTLHLLNPLRSLLQTGLSWPLVILAVALIAYLSSGWRLALAAAIAFFCLGLLGLWDASMDTLSQVLVAVSVSMLIGIPLGIWAARSRRADFVLRPALDFLQTIPAFVYLVPVIMLFNVGRVPGIIASVLYAIPPVIRLTSLGIRQVPNATTEAADSFGSTGRQKLVKVQLPLAKPSILLGINQTIMMVLAMVVIAGLVGGGALGLEAVTGLAKNQIGRGMEAGLAIVILAVVLDRITQAWVRAR